MIFHRISIVSLVLLSNKNTLHVEGHAALSKPAGRQWYSREAGRSQWNSEPDTTLPEKWYGIFGQQAGGHEYGACGKSRATEWPSFTMPGGNYTTPYGNTVPFTSQATYYQGQEIEIEVQVDANHGGIFIFSVCDDWAHPIDPSQDCFDKSENQLKFVEDVLNGGQPDERYPNQGYMAPDKDGVAVYDSETGSQIIRHKYKLPDHIHGDQILLQWHWVSRLGCRPKGYDENHTFPEDWGITNHLTHSECIYDSNGHLPSSGNDPQQYWHCSEVSILPTEPTVSPVPTATGSDSPSVAPTETPQPTSLPTPYPTPAPVSAPCGCASKPDQNQAECNGADASTCGHYITNEDKCVWTDCNNGMPTPEPATPSPIGMTTTAPTQQTSNPPTPTPTQMPPPTPSPTPPPTLVPTSPPTKDCGQCGPQPGKNQAECNGVSFNLCQQYIGEGKCVWTGCASRKQKSRNLRH